MFQFHKGKAGVFRVSSFEFQLPISNFDFLTYNSWFYALSGLKPLDAPVTLHSSSVFRLPTSSNTLQNIPDKGADAYFFVNDI